MIHFTGDVVTIADPEGTRRRQRCAWCGYLLIAQDFELTAVPDGQDGERATLPERRLVDVDGSVTQLLDYVPGQPMPSGACADRDASPAVVFVVTEDQPPFYSGPVETGARDWVKANEAMYGGPLIVTAVEIAREVVRDGCCNDHATPEPAGVPDA
jgi:hypothetical protein